MQLKSTGYNTRGEWDGGQRGWLAGVALIGPGYLRIDAYELVLEKTLVSPLDCKEIQPVHPKGDQSWVFIGRTDVEAETTILWLPDVKSWLIWKDPDAGKDWGQEEKGTTEDEMGWMASLTQWTWVWVNSGSWWWTRRPGVLQFMGSQRVGHDWTTELNWTWGKLVSTLQKECQDIRLHTGHNRLSASPWVPPFQHRDGKGPAWLPSPSLPRAVGVDKGEKFPDGQGTFPNVPWKLGHVEAQYVIHLPSQHEMRMRIISC